MFRIINMYVGSDGKMLFRTSNGFQLDKDSDSPVVKNMGEVAFQSDYVKEMVDKWLANGGSDAAEAAAIQVKIDSASGSDDGSSGLDALALMLGVEFRQRLYAMLEKEIKKKRRSPALMLARVKKSFGRDTESEEEVRTVMFGGMNDDDDEGAEAVGSSVVGSLTMTQTRNGNNINLDFS